MTFGTFPASSTGGNLIAYSPSSNTMIVGSCFENPDVFILYFSANFGNLLTFIDKNLTN